MKNGDVTQIQWRILDGSGSEQASIRRMSSGYLLEGDIKINLEGQAIESHYHIATNIGWETQNVQVEVKAGSETDTLHLTVDELQSWWDGSDEIGVLAGCLDVDLQISPITNTLVINREAMPVGESRLVTAAWILFPDLALQPVRQQYTRLSPNHYRFENLENGYSAEIEVDPFGFVVRYDEIWTRV